MSDETDKLELPEGFKRKPGRPKGLGKVPGSGRKKGTPNKTTLQTREEIQKEADPIGFMCRIVRGLQVECAPEPGSRQRVKCRPTLEQMISAAQYLGRKVLPDMREVAMTGTEGGPIEYKNVSSDEVRKEVNELFAEPASATASGGHLVQ